MAYDRGGEDIYAEVGALLRAEELDCLRDVRRFVRSIGGPKGRR
jgi:hypothetical protein